MTSKRYYKVYKNNFTDNPVGVAKWLEKKREINNLILISMSNNYFVFKTNELVEYQNQGKHKKYSSDSLKNYGKMVGKKDQI